MIFDKNKNRLIIAYDNWDKYGLESNDNVFVSMDFTKDLIYITADDVCLYDLDKRYPSNRKIRSETVAIPYFSSLTTLLYICEKGAYKDILQLPSKNYIPPIKHAVYKKNKLYRILRDRFFECYTEMCEAYSDKVYSLADLEGRIYSIGGRKYFDGLISIMEDLTCKPIPHGFLKEDMFKYRGAVVAYLYMASTRNFEHYAKNKLGLSEKTQTYFLDENVCNWREFMFEGGSILSKGTQRFLDKFPGQVPADFRLYWNTDRRPSRLYFIAHNILAEIRGRGVSEEYYSILERSTDDQIKKALKIARCENVRKVKPVADALSHIFIMPPPFTKNCTIVGWAKHAMKEHEREESLALEKKLARWNEKEVSSAPFPLDLSPIGVKQLMTPKEIITEGHEMKHCVGHYVDNVLKGWCFIFSLNYAGERATIEIAPDGTIIQAQGIRNSQNKATEYAYSEINKYIKKSIKKGLWKPDESLDKSGIVW